MSDVNCDNCAMSDVEAKQLPVEPEEIVGEDPELEELEGADGKLDDSKLKRAAIALTNVMNRVVRDGVGPITGSMDWAESRLRSVQKDRYDGSHIGNRAGTASTDVEKVIKRLITESVVAAGSAGFLTGLGGFVTLPLTIPANLAGALVINVRLAGAIAYLRGYDLNDPHTQLMIPLVAVGSDVQVSLSAIGVQVGIKLSQAALNKLPLSVIRQINARVGITLLAKYGTKRAVIAIAKVIPFVGGFVGGGVDAALTAVVGVVAKKAFPQL
jgi:EcsC protein family